MALCQGDQLVQGNWLLVALQHCGVKPRHHVVVCHLTPKSLNIAPNQGAQVGLRLLGYPSFCFRHSLGQHFPPPGISIHVLFASYSMDAVNKQKETH
jgi:hypothetical protein